MRHQSLKTAKKYRDAKVAHDAFLKEKFLCEACGKRQATEVHHIANLERLKELVARYACLLLCWNCNRFKMEGHCSKAAMLKLLKESRPNDYDLAAFHALRGSATNSITEADVEGAIWKP